MRRRWSKSAPQTAEWTMNTGTMPSVIGVFPGRKETETAIDQLVALGVDKDALGVVWREKAVPRREDVEVIVYVDHFEDPSKEAKKGAIGGAVGGGAAGVGSVLLASAGGVILATPIGSLLAVGTIAAAAAAGAAGAFGGSLTGGILGALLGATDHDATKVTHTEVEYRDAIERDGFVLTINVERDEVETTAEAMASIGAADVSILMGRTEQIRTVKVRHGEADDLT